MRTRRARLSGKAPALTIINGPHDLSVRASTLALLWAGGASLALLSLLVPHGASLNGPAEAAVASVGYPAAALLYRWRRQVTDGMVTTLLVLALLLVGAGVYFAHGGEDGASAFFYVWVALYSGLFMAPWVTAGLWLLAATTYSVVLGLVGGPSGPAEGVLTLGTALVAGVFATTASRRLRAAAEIDALTGLPNRAAAERLLASELSRATRHGLQLSVALVDLDHLKRVNDTEGHAAGDNAIRAAAGHWRSHLREVDSVARLGGDEFLVVMPATPADRAHAALERMIEADASLHYSVGLTTARRDDTVETCLGRADRALYRAKADGGARVVTDGSSEAGAAAAS